MAKELPPVTKKDRLIGVAVGTSLALVVCGVGYYGGAEPKLFLAVGTAWFAGMLVALTMRRGKPK